MGYNQNVLDALAIMSFALGMENYKENLSQSDKDDMMTQMDKTNKELLVKLEADLEEQNQILEKQNQMLEEILYRLK